MWQRNKLSVKERFEDEFIFEGITISQTLETEPPSCVYDAAIIMAKYITDRHRAEFDDATMIELGAGCGFTGIYLAPMVKRGILTDIPNIIPLIV